MMDHVSFTIPYCYAESVSVESSSSRCPLFPIILRHWLTRPERRLVCLDRWRCLRTLCLSCIPAARLWLPSLLPISRSFLGAAASCCTPKGPGSHQLCGLPDYGCSLFFFFFLFPLSFTYPCSPLPHPTYFLFPFVPYVFSSSSVMTTRYHDGRHGFIDDDKQTITNVGIGQTRVSVLR
ncbi:hypothetical protein GQ43DRAFT_288923 [Delitschia confertaspora ATCC 74209]|uniref:Uncharacterized protein n=1 Tax=Delitschia confertaspora ATCC 74209 TaxID=1513339 RepID=A0A9P4JV23_9PLEO|nr:hypothetical protein GQ43DRAFT_288923 [Delitschia confertaspora ATCC 74209]